MGTIAERKRGVMSDGHFLLFQSLPSSALFFIIGSLSSDVLERRTFTGSGLFALLSCNFQQIFGQIVSSRVKALSNAELRASRHTKQRKACFRLTCLAQKLIELLKLPNMLTQQALCSWGHVIKSFLKKIYIMGHNLNNAGDGNSISNIPKWSSLGPWAYRVLFIQQFDLSEN